MDYKQINKQIRSIIDPCDFGEKVTFSSGTVKAIHKNNKITINLWKNKTELKLKKQLISASFDSDILPSERYSYLKTITNKALNAHHAGSETWYYTSQPSGKYDLINLDFDDKKKLHGDTEQAAEYLLRYFPNLFIQPSTSGTGTHGYMLVEHCGLPASDRKRLYGIMRDNMVVVLKMAGFRCSEDLDSIKGTPSVTSWHQDNAGQWYIQYNTLGCLAKIPRLTSDNDVYAFALFLTKPTNIETVKTFNTGAGVVVRTEIGSATTKNAHKVIENQQVTTNSIGGYKRRLSALNKWRQTHPYTGQYDYESLHNYYIENYEHTDDNNTKEERIRDWKQCDHKFTFSQPKQIDLNAYCEIIKQVIPEADFKDEKLAKRRQTVSVERLAQLLAVMVRDIKKKEFKQVARDTYINCFAKLKEAGIIDWTLNTNTFSFYHNLLVKYQFIEVVSEHIAPYYGENGKGVARTLALGERLKNEQHGHIRTESLVRSGQNEQMGAGIQTSRTDRDDEADHLCSGHQIQDTVPLLPTVRLSGPDGCSMPTDRQESIRMPSLDRTLQEYDLFDDERSDCEGRRSDELCARG